MKKPTKKDYEILGRELVSCPEGGSFHRRLLADFYYKFNIPQKKKEFIPPPSVLLDMFPESGTSRKIIK